MIRRPKSKLQRAREAMGLSRGEIAHQLGVTEATIWNWERYPARFLGTHADLCRILGADIRDLVEP